MKASNHIYVSITTGGAVYFATRSAVMAAACLLTGVLMDLDHVLDFFLFANEKFTFKNFFSWCYELRWGKTYLILHSVELYFLLAIIARYFPSNILTGILLGMGPHLVMDQLGNKNLNQYFYFLAFRYQSGFKKPALITKPL